jgi:hypothetical protein
MNSNLRKSKRYFCTFAFFICSLLGQENFAQPTSNNNWSAEIFYVSERTINIYKEPTTDAEVSGHFVYLEKLLIVIDYSNPCNFGWQKVVYPQKGYVEDKFLITHQIKAERDKRYGYKDDDEYSRWQWNIKFCSKNYSFVKEFPDYQSLNVGMLKKEEKVLVVVDAKNNKIWTKILYPVEGYILSENIFEDVGSFVLSVGGSYGVSQIPYEKNLTNLKNPIGGFLEFSKTNWRLSFRVGYNHSGSKISTYNLKTDLIYLQVRYNFLRMFNNHLNPYIFAGGCYWNSSFQNTKYPELASYFPLEKDNGTGYMFGVGLIFSINNFVLDVQYFYFGSKQAVFGKEPQPGQFTNQYKLYPGSNQVNVMLGYRFVF